MRKVMKLFICVIEWLFVKILQPFFYRKQYLKGKWFESITALGWRWAATDIVHRILFQTNLGVPWPVSPYMKCGSNIEFHVDDINNFQGAGNYFQTFSGKITIGKGTYIAQNVGIITANHDLMEPDVHQQGKEVILGEKCWIGMNAVILPGVKLGDHTVVGAGSVVTKSFEEGYCVVAGNPGRQIRRL